MVFPEDGDDERRNAPEY